MSLAEYAARIAVAGLMSVSTSVVLLFCLYKFIRHREAVAGLASFAQRAAQSLQVWVVPKNLGPSVLNTASINTASQTTQIYFQRITRNDPPSSGPKPAPIITMVAA